MKTQIENKRSFRILPEAEVINQGQVIEKFLEAENYFFKKEVFFPHARRLIKEPKSLGSSLAHFFGYIYIQDRASMLPPVALNPPKGAFVLDMSASPGSKTTMLSAMVGKNGLVIGNEINQNRLSTLKRNIETTYSLNTITCRYDATKLPLPNNFVPYILLDPPCSGWGTVEKNPQVEKIWTPEKAKTLVNLQKQLLIEAERILAFGGELVYSTCTTNKEENEAQVEFAIKELGLELIPLEELPEFTHAASSLQGVWRFEPILKDTQGFFVAKFRKKGLLNPIFTSQFAGSSHYFEKKFQGSLVYEGKNVSFMPYQGKVFADIPNFHYQLPVVGKVASQGFIFSSKMRAYPEGIKPLVFEGKTGITQIKALLTGQSYNAENINSENYIPFYFEELALGLLTRKGKRLLFTL